MADKSKYVPRLKDRYNEQVIAALTEKFGYKNPMEVPRIEKIVVNMGVGEAVNDRKHLQGAVEEMTLITGQKPIATKAKKSIATFRLREGMAIGAKTTLRNNRMYEFLDRLTNIALPRVRDFRGVSPKAFDGRGNYSLGIKEQIVFQEINYDDISAIRGLQVVVCTTAKTDDEARELLRLMDMPFTS